MYHNTVHSQSLSLSLSLYYTSIVSLSHTHTLFISLSHTHTHTLYCTCSIVYRVHLPPQSSTAQGTAHVRYEVVTISRLLKTTGLFCRIQSVLEGSFAKETYHFKERTNRSHPIVGIVHVPQYCTFAIIYRVNAPHSSTARSSVHVGESV